VKGRVIVVDDDAEMGELLRDRLVRRDFEVRAFCSPEVALDAAPAA